MPRLVFKKGENPPVELAGPLVIGRSSEQANVAIKDNRLSRAHCRLEPRDGTWAVVDLGSQNGTFVNGKRVQESVLKAGDIITVGAVDMSIDDAPVFESSDSTRTVVAPAALVQVKGSLKERMVPILGDSFTIGRKPGNMLVLEEDTKVSGNHARIVKKPDGYVLEDLESRNGVAVNGHRITEPVLLKIGQLIIIGNHTFQFIVAGKESETSGTTAPLALKDIATAKGAGKQAVERGEELGQAMDEEAQIAASEAAAESKAADHAALTQGVKFKGAGGALIGVVEVLVVLAIAAGTLYAGYTLLTEKRAGGGAGDAAIPPVRDGGLAKADNPSFETLDGAMLPEGWGWDVRGGDQASKTDAAHGGQYALQLSRFTAQNSISFMVGPMKEAPKGGVKVSVYAVNSELSADRAGTAVVSLMWYRDARDNDILVITPVATRTSMRDWTLLEGSMGVPPGATAYRVALGISGKPGSVVYDDLALEEAAEAPTLLSEAESKASDSRLAWRLLADGSFEASLGAGQPLLKQGRLLVHRREGAEDPLNITDFLTAPPQVTATKGSLEAVWTFFDPVAEKPAEIRMKLGASGDSFTAGAALAAAPAEGKLYVSFTFVATPLFIPAELIRMDGVSVQEYRNEIGVGARERQRLTTLVAADTAKGNRIEGGEGSPTVSISPAPGGRDCFFQGALACGVNFSLGGERERLAELTAQIAGVQPGEDQVDRVARAITIMADFPFNQSEIALAARAMDSAAVHYKLRQLELNDGINVHELTRNENLYIAAMDECIRTSDRLTKQVGAWNDAAGGPLVFLSGVNMSERSQQAAQVARNALMSLAKSSGDFEVLAQAARRARFLLAVSIEQRESELFLVSARDYLSSGLPTQGRLKLAYIVENYPRCLRGIEAKELMVEQAAAIIEDAKRHEAQGLTQIARTERERARGYLDLVESKLLRNILSNDEIMWLRGLRLDTDDAGAWMNREEALVQRIRTLRSK